MSPFAALPLPVRKASGFPIAPRNTCGYAAEAKPPALSPIVGKPEAFRTESGKAARQCSVLAKQSSDLVHQLQ